MFLLLWIVGWSFGVAGNFVHVVLILVLIMVALHFGMGRKTV
ncbi:MAG: DUF5670 family protein [Terriglobales bacterium]